MMNRKKVVEKEALLCGVAGIGGVLRRAAAVRGPGTVHFICLGGGVCPVPALWPPEGLCLVPAVSPGFRWRSDGEEYPYYLPAHRDAHRPVAAGGDHPRHRLLLRPAHPARSVCGDGLSAQLPGVFSYGHLLRHGGHHGGHLRRHRLQPGAEPAAGGRCGAVRGLFRGPVLPRVHQRPAGVRADPDGRLSQHPVYGPLGPGPLSALLRRLWPAGGAVPPRRGGHGSGGPVRPRLFSQLAGPDPRPGDPGPVPDAGERENRHVRQHPLRPARLPAGAARPDC